MNKRTLACLLFAVLSLTTVVGLVYGQEATSFKLDGTVKQATGELAPGLTVTAINQRVQTGWLVDPEFTTRDDGSYDIAYVDPFGGNVTRVGDELVITVTNSEGNPVGGRNYVVTAADVEAGGATVDIILGGIQVALDPGALDADGSSTSSITIKIYGEDGAPVTDDTPTITSARGAMISEVMNNGDGSYTATYTAPALADITAAVEDQLTVMSVSLDDSTMASLTLNVPKTVVTVAISPTSAEFSSVSSDMGAVSVTVMRAGMPITDETISFELTRGDGVSDVGSIADAVDAGVAGVYEFTYTPSKMVGEIQLVATAKKAGVSSDPVMITINAGPPAEITLMADLTTLSGGQSARITITVMDASSNGVGGLEDDLNVSTSGSGTVGQVAKGSTFGEYTVTYTAPAVVAAAGKEEVTVSVPDSDVSGTIMLDLTPVPPREVSIIVITGTVFKKNSEVPAPGVTVSVMINGVSIPTDVDMTGPDGAYTATRVIPGGVAARTGDRVVVVVTDSTGERGRVDFALTNDQLGEGTSTTITQNIDTDIKLTATTLVVLGNIFLEDGESPVDTGLSVTVTNRTRSLTQPGVTEADGYYQVTFVGLGNVVAETDDELVVMVEDADGNTFEGMPYALTGDNLNDREAEINVTTDFTADPTKVMVVQGTVMNPDGSRAEAGIVVAVTIGDRDPGMTTTDADGSYSYRHTFVETRGGSAAMPGDIVTVEILRESTGEEGIEITDPLLSKDILNRYVTVDVQFPAAIIEITPPMPVSLDSDGNGMVDIVATITDAAGKIVTGLSITAEVDGMGSVTSSAMDNGDGTYTVTYTAANKMIGENLATVTMMAADEPGIPMDSTMVSVIDEMPPTVMVAPLSAVVGLDQTVTFDSSGTMDNVDDADDLSYSWDFNGDGVEDSDEASPTFSSTTPGVYDGQVTVMDTSGNVSDPVITEVIVGGLVVRGSIVEADGMDLMSPVTVKIMHTSSGEYVMAEVDGANYEGIFEKDQSDKFKAGDSLMIEVETMGDSPMPLGSALHTIAQDELDSGIANVEMDVRIDRTSTYTITGLVLGDGLQPIEGAIVMAETAGGLKVSDMTDDIGSYSLLFDDFIMNPTVGEEIAIMAEVPDGIPLRTSIIAFMQEGSRISRADLRSVRLGGLGLNTPHYHRFVHDLIEHIIGGTSVAQALQDATPEQQRRVTNGIIKWLNNSVPGGLFPAQLAIGPDLPMDSGYPLIFEDPEYMDLENFGNGIFPSPLTVESLGTALNVRRGDLTPVLTGDKLDLYLSVPILHADKVMFQLAGPGGMMPMSAERVTRPFSHTFQLEEEQAILFLPSWPGLNPDMPEVFSSVSLMYKSQDAAPIGTALGANLRLGAVLQKSLSDLDTELSGLLQNALPAAAQAEIVAFQETLRTVKNELPSGPQLDRIRNDLNELKKLQIQLEALRGGMIVPDLYKGLGEIRELLVMVQAGLPAAARSQITELQGTITGVEGALSNFLNPSVAPQLETDYMEMPMMSRQIGDQVIWETVVDDIQPGKQYNYYYKVALANPVKVELPGFAPIMVSQWAMPDPRNLQVEDRGIIERLITPEVQSMIAAILNPTIEMIAAGQEAPPPQIGVQHIRPGFELALALLPVAAELINQIGTDLDPMLDSVFTVPVLDGSQSLWIGKYDFGTLPDGEYTLSASVYDSSGEMIPDTQLPGKRFMVDRTAPMAKLAIEHDPNVIGMYQREDGSHVATLLPTAEGSATLKVTAMPVGPQDGLFGYIYQMMPVNGNLWGPLVVTNRQVNTGLARDILSDLVTGVPLVVGIQAPDMVRDAILDDLSMGFDLLDEIPITLSEPHQLHLLVRTPTPPELAALVGQGVPLPIDIGAEMTTLQLNNYRVRAVGIDNMLNVSSHTVPMGLDIVSPDADKAMISYIVLGDCNGDGDTDDFGESGAADGSSLYTNMHTDLKLTVKIMERTMHPLTSISVEYSMDGGATWMMIDTLDMMALKDAEQGSTFEIDWSVDNYDELVATGVENLMVRAVTTNALTLMDTEPMKATITVDDDVCPVPPTVLGVQVMLQDTNPDSDPDVNDLDSEGNPADGPMVGGAMGNITAIAYTPYRTGPDTSKVRFEVRRKNDTEWKMVENNMAMESVVVKSEDMPESVASVLQGLVGMVADGTPTVPIPTRYQKWMVEINTAALDDTITKDDAAGGRDVRIDENPYIIRAVAIAGDTDYTNDRVHDSFSVDNKDDVAPLESTMIVMVSDNAMMQVESDAGVFTVGGIVDADDENVDHPPVAMLTAKPRAHVSTFHHIKLFVNMRNADGTLGGMVDVGEVVFEHSEGNYYTATLDLSIMSLYPNAEFAFQALAIDAAMNVEMKVDEKATPADVENYRPPPDSVTIVDWMDDTEKDVAAITEAYPRGYLVTKSFTFTVKAVGIHPPEIGVMIGDSSAKIMIEKTDDGGGGLADLRTFVVTVDTSTIPDGKYMTTGVVTKLNGSSAWNGSSDFGLPMLNIDNTGPMVDINTPQNGHELSSLPTIKATFNDGIGSGVQSSSDTVMLELVRLMPGGAAVDIPINQDEVEKPDAYIVEDGTEMGDIVYTSTDVLAGGAYRLTIKVTDILGNTTNMGMGMSVDFTIAGTLPGVSIQSPMSGQVLDYDMPEIIVVYSGVGTEIKSFTLTNAANEPVEVNDPVMVSDPAQLDNNKMSYTATEALDDGKYTAAVMVEDANGEVARDSVTFMVSADDTTKAVVTQVSPQGVVKSDTVTLSVQAFDEQSGVDKVMISIDKGTAKEGDTQEVTDLTHGSHIVDVVVTNGVGLETEYSWTFTVVLDTTGPEISATAPHGTLLDADVMVSAVVIDHESAINKVTIAVDSYNAGRPEEIGGGDIESGKISLPLTGLKTGTHTVTIFAESDGGPTTHSWTFTVKLDETGPEISSVAPQGIIRQDSVQLSAVVIDNESPIESVTIALDDGDPVPVASADFRNGRVGRDIEFVEMGTHTVTIVATSKGGSTSHAWTFTVDLDKLPPTITSTGPHGLVRKERPVLSVVADDDMSGVEKIEITLEDSSGEEVEGEMTQSSAGNSAIFIPTRAFTDDTQGTYVAKTTVTDVSGNQASTQWTFTVAFDTVAPVVTTATPQGEARITERKPLISAAYTDADSGINVKSVKLWVDGKPVQPTKVTPSQVTYMPPADLKYGRYTVKLEVADLATRGANKTTHEWSFTVEAKTTRIVDARPIPNPFKSSTTITLTLSRQARVTVEIYDLSSRLVRTLRRGRMYDVGDATKIVWDGKTDTGEDLARGVYLCRIVVDSELMPQTKVLKLALTR